MLNFKVNKGSGSSSSSNEHPSRFKRFVVRKDKKLNELTAEQKVVSAITECLAMQGREDGKNYYIDGNTVTIDKTSVTPSGRRKDGRDAMSYSSSGSFRIGKIDGEVLRRGAMTFNLSFKDSEDDMGLDALEIVTAEMSELPLSR